MKVIVIGAGIVGLATAWWMARDGHEVTVLDEAEQPGSGASFANGAQLSYSYVAPLAEPAILKTLPKYMLDRNGPLRFVPRADPGQWSWLLRFLAACNATAAAHGTASLLRLSFASRDALHAMLAATPMAFDHARNGKLVVQSSVQAMQAAQAQMRLQAALGCEQQALTAAECLALEPGLASIRQRLVGGILTPSEEVGDCHKLCLELARVLTKPAFGATLLSSTRVERLVVESGRLRAVRTSRGDHEAELTVLAAGVGTPTLGRSARVTVPVLALRGYSITAPIRASNCGPRHSITDSARKTVYAPLGAALRVAGFAEIGTTTPTPGRTEALARETEAVFPGACDTAAATTWTGLRPATPTSLPLIGPTRIKGLALNAGQGALGFTLAAGSARLLADLVAGRDPPVDPAPFRP
ncbi:MAG: D-amino acid dehydrogenase [Rhodospirillales bacterium]|nr:D-amino acid dehydrogenase [Rhodospirillales bacterium]